MAIFPSPTLQFSHEHGGLKGRIGRMEHGCKSRIGRMEHVAMIYDK
jgi:hypothetical protein